MKKILVNLVHPNIENSVVNKKLINAISNLENVTINNLYTNYPDFKIDVKKEQELLLNHDVIVFQFPMYWFSSPSLLKEWFDFVLEYDFAYGANYKLENKVFAVAVSCGGDEKVFDKNGKDKKSVEEFLSPFFGTANYIKMDYKKPFIIYQADQKIYNEKLDKYVENFVEYIKELSR
ncbi:NAD(P)H-dependent oxidoreductase [Aliarcobacter skirrowii]|uniref:NAD(P)H-dependent oxidoreductase n=1 Tax=Aliarcobacter skirrowii TaxID=28200 RepID=UPI000D616F6E|nr:NAD(P)H-dependent oxidoreductase [Aliarcobacter skirrowii]PWE22497.1 general stress protein [Aliarcobacter skirrowii]PWE24919.1 general stress protein [Aliarcobacter skirrowii]RJO56855.1 general stress protein [Aliarcobacter skirrowii]RJO58809.1 general stress protein [Aliarcobacter skirrowii]